MKILFNVQKVLFTPCFITIIIIIIINIINALNNVRYVYIVNTDE